MIMITGAHGVVGRAVTDLLLREDTGIAAVTRGSGSAAFPKGVRAVSGDLYHPPWIEAALEGVEALQISPRATRLGLGELLRLAVKQGVRRVVLLWATTVACPAGEARFAARFQHAEDLVRGSGRTSDTLTLANLFCRSGNNSGRSGRRWATVVL